MRFDSYGAVIIGGGFYGCVVARELRKYFARVLVLESEGDLMQRASYRNQARVHRGYHYPRSLLTSLRSRLNFSRFALEYEPAIFSEFQNYYAIAKTFSKTTAGQFEQFCRRIGAPISPARDEIKALFNAFHIEEIFSAVEYAFDAAKLRGLIKSQLAAAEVECEFGAFAQSLRPSGGFCRLVFEQGGALHEAGAQYIFNCGYSRINGVLWRSGLPLLPLKHEFAEMGLIEVPDELKGLGLTIMDGPFFAVMPFPDRGLHTLHHVRYTPHHSWMDAGGEGYLDARQYFERARLESNYEYMIRDAVRYIPSMSGSRFVESLWEIKTILPAQRGRRQPADPVPADSSGPPT